LENGFSALNIEREGDDIMDFRYLKILAIGLALVFVTQGCAVVVRDRDYHHHRGYRHHSSLQQSDRFAAQVIAQNTGVPEVRD
jgi:hypothetical protein